MEIPEDIREMAREANMEARFMSSLDLQIDIIARAILAEREATKKRLIRETNAVIQAVTMAERERCAKIAAEHPGVKFESGNRLQWRLPSQHEIAVAIRKGD